MTPAQPSRRAVAKGTAWAVPAVVVAASAPAVAASPKPTYQISGITKYNQYWTSTSLDNRFSIKVYSSSGTAPGQGFCVTNTTTSTKLTSAVITYWFASPSLSFARNTTYGSSCWSSLSLDSSRGTRSYQGCTYYPYTATVTCSIPAVNGTTCLPTLAVESQTMIDTPSELCDVCPDQYNCPTRLNYFVESSITVNGAKQTRAYGPIAVTG